MCLLLGYVSHGLTSLVLFGRRLSRELGGLLSELCYEQVMMHVSPADVKLRKKQRKVETEVADLRCKLSLCAGKNLVLSNREIRLLRLVGCRLARLRWPIASASDEDQEYALKLKFEF